MAADNHSVAPSAAPPLRNRFKAALALAGGTVASWSRGKGHTESLVWMNLSGERYTAEIRADIATVLETTSEHLDEEIARERVA